MTPHRCLPAGSAVAWRCEPQGASQGCPGASTLLPHSGKRRRRMKPSHACSPYPSLPASAGQLSSAVLSFPSLQRFIFVSSVICNEPQ